MGVNNGALSPDQISVSSQLESGYNKNHLKLDDATAWQPLINSLTEFVEFNFLEQRTVTGLATKGGPNGWVTLFTVQYSQNGKDWNAIMEGPKKQKEFLGNFDGNSPRVNNFDMPISAQYLRINPTKWHNNIQMRIEPHGCFEPYRKYSSLIVDLALHV